MRRLAATMLLGVLLLQAGAAPVPPSRLVTAEVVVALMGANPQEVVKKLQSRAVLDAIARSDQARQLRCVRLDKDPEGWLAARLKTSVDEKRGVLIIRVEGCPGRDALPLLWAVLDGYKTHVCPSHLTLAEAHRRHQALVRTRARFICLLSPVDDYAKEYEDLVRTWEAKVNGFLIQRRFP